MRLALLVLGIGLAAASYLPGCDGLLPIGVICGLVGAGMPVLGELGGG